MRRWSPGNIAGDIELVGTDKGSTSPNILSMIEAPTKMHAMMAVYCGIELVAL